MENHIIKLDNEIACEYCATLFKPKRRWMQKYCCESCRTLACRERKHGKGGTLAEKKRSVGITDLYHFIHSENQIIQSQLAKTSEYYSVLMFTISNLQSDIAGQKTEQVYEIVKGIAKRIPDDLNSKINNIDLKLTQQEVAILSIGKRQKNHLYILLIAMMIAPEIGKKLFKMFESDNIADIDLSNVQEQIINLQSALEKMGLCFYYKAI